MTGTRATRGRDAKKPEVEELRFDFTGDDEPADQVRDPPSSSPDPVSSAKRPTEKPLVASSPPPVLSVVAFEPVVEAGSVSDKALSISDFYGRVKGALRETFPDEVWVTGEIRKVTTSRGHHFLELADRLDGPDRPASDGPAATRAGLSRNLNATLEVACWARDWPVIEYALEAVGVELTPGLVVRVRGTVTVWEGGGKLRFSMTALDVEALVGGIAAARRRLLGTLASEDLLEANRRLTLPLVPLRIGLVTSPGSEAYRDFTGQLERSGYLFDVRFEPSLVQGPEAPAQIVGALTRLGAFEPQLVVVVRGGGARGDLAAFDSEPVARAIAAAPFPVWTGIGHTGDRSVADEVAHQALVTPTQCGEAVVAMVAAYLEGVDRRARRLAQRVEVRLNQAGRELGASCASTRRAARQALERASLSLHSTQTRIGNAALVAIERSQGRLVNRAQRLAGPSSQLLAAQGQHVAHQRELLQLLDPRHQLERGWTLTRDQGGKVVRSSASLRLGERLITIFADGSAGSVVDEIRPPVQRLVVKGETERDGGIP
jgi:exodeoxyribonuclease VII large subunit